MPFPIQRAILKGRLLGLVATRNMFVAEIDPFEPYDPAIVWAGYLGAIWDNISIYMSTGWVAETIEIQNLEGTNWVTVKEIPSSLAGSSTSPIVANLLAAVLVGKAIGKRLVGRKFFSGLTEAVVEANSMTSAALSAFAGAAIDYISPFTGSDTSVLQPGIVDKNFAFHGFVSGFVASLLGTMRRRKPGLGI